MEIMKKFLSIMVLCYLALATYAQNNISLYVYAPKQQERIPKSSMNYLVNSLCSAITTEGLAAQDDYMTQFVLIPKINIVSKNVLSSTQQQIVYSVDVALQVADNISGIIFASEMLNLKGVGTNETKAYNSAFHSLNKNNKTILSFINMAKQKILSYYEDQGDNILKKASLLAQQEKYDEAFYLLSMIPSQCSKYDLAISKGIDIWKSYKDYSCSVNIAKARSVWIANQTIEAANEAGMYLSRIFQDAKCYGDAMQLYKDIKTKVGDLWNFSMKTFDNEHELRMAKVKAIQAIGVAYGKGQQPDLVINKSLY